MKAGFASIIIIFLNMEKFLAEAIRSVLDQSYKDWELLLVDDGSTDGSTLIAQQFAEEHSERVRYIEHAQHQNRGMSSSRNLGIQNSTGEFLAFLDADDVLTSNALEDQISILRSHPEAAMVYGPIQYWFSWTGNIEDSQRDYVERLGVPANSVIPPPALLPLFLQDKAAVPSGILVRREIIDQVGGFEESFHSFYEDQVFCAKVCLAASVYAAEECWYKYRQHSGNSCSIGQITGEYFSARLDFLHWLESYLVTAGIQYPEVWRAFHQEMRPYRYALLHRLLRSYEEYQSKAQQLALSTARRILPNPIYRWLAGRWQAYKGLPSASLVRFGDLRRFTPLSRDWGFDRGLPIDRYYIEKFLADHATEVCGQILEIGDNTYTHQFGGDRVTRSDVLHVKPGDPKVTVIADLTCADHIPANTFDCIILTQTLHLIYETRDALNTLYRILKPGGSLLMTVPGISQISRYDMDRWGDYWRFTTRSTRQLLGEIFPIEEVKVTSYGNVLSAAALLYGLATHELYQEELMYHDPDYEVLIAARAAKPIPKGF